MSLYVTTIGSCSLLNLQYLLYRTSPLFIISPFRIENLSDIIVIVAKEKSTSSLIVSTIRNPSKGLTHILLKQSNVCNSTHGKNTQFGMVQDSLRLKESNVSFSSNVPDENTQLGMIKGSLRLEESPVELKVNIASLGICESILLPIVLKRSGD
jgi:hypothetical protein